MAKTRSKFRGKAKRYTIELTSISALIWSIILLFLFIWIFVLGIFAGQGFLPSTVQTTISDLKNQIRKYQEMVSRKETYDSTTLQETGQGPELAFYEKLASKKDEVKNNWEVETKVDTPEEKKLPLTSEEVQETRVDEKAQINLPEKEEHEPSVSAGMYTVQIASIRDREKAEKFIIDLIGQGYDAYFYEADVKGKRYYRIRCGRFSSREEALDYSQKLEKEAGLKGFVTRIE